MKLVCFFENEEELSRLTGLTEEQMWDAGFNLDDWDWGFMADKNYIKEYIDDYGYECQGVVDDAPEYIRRILNWMDIFCCGFSVVEYGKNWFYIVYHA